MEIAATSSSAYLPRPVGADALVPAVALPAAPTSEPLSPAAKVELGTNPPPSSPSSGHGYASGDEERRRFSLDTDGHELVFQVYDQTSGAVVDQLPSESVVRARAYARELAEQESARAATSKTVNRTA